MARIVSACSRQAAMLFASSLLIYLVIASHAGSSRTAAQDLLLSHYPSILLIKYPSFDYMEGSNVDLPQPLV